MEDIALTLGTTTDEVDEVLATMRTRNPKASRGNLNVTIAAREFVFREADDAEAVWSVVDRLFIELMYRRAWGGAPLVKGEPDPG